MQNRRKPSRPGGQSAKFCLRTSPRDVELLIAPDAPKVREDHRRQRSLLSTFADEFKKSQQWRLYAKLLERLSTVQANLKTAKLHQTDAEGQFTAAVANGDDAEIETERIIMENHLAAASKLAAEIDALKPAVIAAFAECRDAFNRQWREAEQTRHVETKARVQAVLDKINVAIASTVGRIAIGDRIPQPAAARRLLDPCETALGALPPLEVEEDVCEPVPTMVRQPHPLAFSR